MSSLLDWFDAVQQMLFEAVVQPLLFNLGLGGVIEEAYDWTMWLLIGLLQVAFLLLVFGTLQRWRPVEPVIDRGQVRLDIFYTLIHRLAIFRIVLFFLVQPLWDEATGWAHVMGFTPFGLDEVWPGVTDQPWVSLIIYLIAFDLVEYLYHRAQHRFEWLWALHAVHHSQRQMTMWSDNRNHLLDSILHDSVIVFVSLAIGVPPAQFVMIVVFTQLVESFSHANVRLSFGRLGERVLVSPRFHRQHHSIAFDVSAAGPAKGNNFAVLFPVWDLIFGTGQFDDLYPATGIHDQLPEAGGRNYGRGFLTQQWLGLKRMVGLG